MLRLRLGDRKHTLKTVLCLGAHCDDIEIGCGGTMLRLTQDCAGLEIYWVIFSGEPVRRRETRKSAALFLQQARSRTVEFMQATDTYFPYEGHRIKKKFEALKERISPDLIFTHFRHDLHQDHRLISELTWNAFRNHLILEYEIPKYDGDFASPNIYVNLDESTCRRKVNHILDSYASQKNKHWFTEEMFRSLMRIRGMEANSPTGYSEGFYCRKATI